MGSWAATQSFASQVEYNHLLGSPLFMLSKTPIYSPIEIITWSRLFGTTVPNVVDGAMVWLWGFVWVGFFATMMAIKKKKVLTSHGSARWADVEDIKKMGLLDGEGVILGRSPDGKHLLQHNGPEHIIVMAPTRSGRYLPS